MTCISGSSDFALYLEDYLMHEHHTLGLWVSMSVWLDIWPKINISHYDLYFMVQWFCLISINLFGGWTSYFEIISQYDTMFNININVSHCDLYVMVHWFCLISVKLFSGWTSYFGIMSQYDTMFNVNINVSHCDLYFMFCWFCLMS